MTSYSRTCPLAFFSLILLFVTCVTSETVPFNFNTTFITNCYTAFNSNCSLLDPAFYNGSAPSSFDDAVFIIYNDTAPVTLYLTNSTLNISSITISGSVTLELKSGSLLEVHIPPLLLPFLYIYIYIFFVYIFFKKSESCAFTIDLGSQLDTS
jgi:hypothetical protein